MNLLGWLWPLALVLSGIAEARSDKKYLKKDLEVGRESPSEAHAEPAVASKVTFNNRKPIQMIARSAPSNIERFGFGRVCISGYLAYESIQWMSNFYEENESKKLSRNFKYFVLGLYGLSWTIIALELLLWKNIFLSYFLLMVLTMPITVFARLFAQLVSPSSDDSKYLILYDLACYAAIVLVMHNFHSYIDPFNRPQEISYQEFIESDALKRGLIDRLIVNVDKTETAIMMVSDFRYASYKFTIMNAEKFEADFEAIQRGRKHRLPILYEAPSNLSKLVPMLPTALYICILYKFVLKKNYSNVKEYDVKSSKVKVNFDDVIGVDDAKREIQEFVTFLQEPETFEGLGAKIPKGALLSGPPGCGKTLLAKAVAGEANVPFLYMSGSDFAEVFVGVGSSRVRALFERAKSLAPCIIFIDEIDTIGTNRNRLATNDEHSGTLNQLLVQMDGFDSTSKIIVFGGTNRPDGLDPALTRPGRFDRHIRISPPSKKGRRDLFGHYMKGLPVDTSAMSLEAMALQLARETPSFTGADIANVCNEAAILAGREAVQQLGFRHLLAAVDKVQTGFVDSSMRQSPAMLLRTAYHEAGHTLIAWKDQYGPKVSKVTILPRSTGSLGHAAFLPAEDDAEDEDYDVTSITKNQILGQIRMALGGRLAEELKYPDAVTAGAASDLQRATKLAYQYVSSFGFDEVIGPISIPPQDGIIHRTGHDVRLSESTAKHIDLKVHELVNACKDEASQILRDNEALLDDFAGKLLTCKSMNSDELTKILGPKARPAEKLQPKIRTPVVVV